MKTIRPCSMEQNGLFGIFIDPMALDNMQPSKKCLLNVSHNIYILIYVQIRTAVHETSLYRPYRAPKYSKTILRRYRPMCPGTSRTSGRPTSGKSSRAEPPEARIGTLAAVSRGRGSGGARFGQKRSGKWSGTPWSGHVYFFH